MPIGNVLTLEDLFKIREVLEEEGFGGYNLKVTIPLLSKEAFDRVNEEFYYKNNTTGTPPECDKINVRIGEISFEYVLEENAG